MPYILQEKRVKLNPLINDLWEKIENREYDKQISNIVVELKKDQENLAGNLNYTLTVLMLKSVTKPSYKVYNNLVGILELCKHGIDQLHETFNVSQCSPSSDYSLYRAMKLILYVLRTESSTVVNGFDRYKELVGMLECCKLEFYRKYVVPYEEEKMKENGDVNA